MPPESWSDYRQIADNRDEIAVLIWRIVAEFIHDTQPLVAEPGRALWEVAERYIFDNAEAAEQQTIQYGRCRPRGEVITEVLTELSLADDYWRIKRGEQHMAFEDA
jgi:hypothetical protein